MHLNTISGFGDEIFRSIDRCDIPYTVCSFYEFWAKFVWGETAEIISLCVAVVTSRGEKWYGKVAQAHLKISRIEEETCYIKDLKYKNPSYQVRNICRFFRSRFRLSVEHDRLCSFVTFHGIHITDIFLNEPLIYTRRNYACFSKSRFKVLHPFPVVLRIQ
jgi:hypothetical protein